MSGYAQAIMGVTDMLTHASADAAYEAAYGQFYTSFMQMQNAANQKVAAEANIAAIKQDRINTDTVIAMQQDEAEARAKVTAAVAGKEGQSVESAVYQTEVNSSVAKANNRKHAEQQIENQLASIYQAQSTLLAVDEPNVPKQNLTMDLAKAASGLMGGMGNPNSYSAELMQGVDSLFTSGDIVQAG